MKRTNKNAGSINIGQFVNEFNDVVTSFQSNVEHAMELITGSFEITRKESEEVSSLFSGARSEAEVIFSLFSAIASLFSGGGGGILNALLGLVPGGELINTLFGGSLPILHRGASAESSIYPAVINRNSAPTVIVNTQLEKAGIYRVYREGKLIAESRP